MSSTSKRDEPVAVIEHRESGEEWALSSDRVPVFSVRRPLIDDDGNVVPEAVPETITYTMPRKPNPGMALRFLKMARTMGDVASSWLIEQAIGEEGYEALADELGNYDGDPSLLLRQITEKIQRVVMGGLDGGPKA